MPVSCPVERLVAWRALLEKAEWTPSPPPITPLSREAADRRKAELQVAYLQHRMQAERGDP